MATITQTSQRVTVSGAYKDFTGGSGSTTTVIQFASGDAPASGDAGRFLLWKVTAGQTGTWQVRFIESATATTVTVGDGGFSSAPPNGATFAISTNMDDVATGAAGVVVQNGASYSFTGRDFQLASDAFVADTNVSVSCDSQQTGSGFIATYPVGNGCVLQFGRLIGGEANDSTETTGGCQLNLETNNSTLMFTNQGSYNANGPVLNFYGCLIESSGPAPFIRATGPIRIIGCICDGPMGGRMYSVDSELADTRFSGNVSGGVAWSLGASFTRPISNAFFFQNSAAIKSFQDFQGTFTDVIFADSNTTIIQAQAQSPLLFQFIDCTTFPDTKISSDTGNYEQLKSINYTVTDSAGTGLNGALVAVYDNTGGVQGGGVKTSSSGAVAQINARFFRKAHSQVGSTSYTPFDIRIRKYGYIYRGFSSAVSDPIKAEIRLSDNPQLVSTEAQAAAISGISLNFSTSTLTITGNTTTGQLYDYYQYQLAQSAQMPYGEDLVRSGDSFDLSDWDMVVDGATYTGSVTTTGTITLQSGAELIGTRTDTNGTTTVTTLTLTGLQANTEVRVFDVGTTTEVAGVENSGTTFTANLDESSVDIVLHAIGYEYQKIKGADTSANLTLPISQRFDRNYRNP